MRKIILTVCVLALCPLVSLARVGKPTPRAPVIPTTGVKSAFDKPALRDVGTCRGECAQKAGLVLSRKAVKAVNPKVFQGENAIVVGNVLKLTPAISTSVQNRGASPKEAKETTDAVVAAVTQSATWADSVAQKNVVKFVRELVEQGHHAKLSEVRNNCRLL